MIYEHSGRRDTNDENDNIMSMIKNEISQRKFLKYTFYSIIKYYVWWMIWRSKSWLRSHSDSRKHLYHQIGRYKLHKELDIINLVRSVRELKTLSSILMSKHQILLVKYQQDNLLHSSSSESELDDNLNILELTDHRNESVRDVYQSELKECLEKFKDSLENWRISEIEARILNGILHRCEHQYTISYSQI